MNTKLNSHMNDEYTDINLKQRRADAYFRNNPSFVLNSSVNTFSGTPLGGSIDPEMGGYEDAPGTNYGEADIPLNMEIIKKPVFNNIVDPVDTDVQKYNLPIDTGNPLPMNLSNEIENFSVSYFDFRMIFVLILHIVALIILIFVIWKYT